MSEPISSPMPLCPSCGAALQPEAVLCVKCGFHLQRGVHLAQVSGWDDVERSYRRDPSNPHAPPAIQEAGSGSLWQEILANLWFRGRIPRWKWWTINAILFVFRFGVGGMLEADIIPAALVLVFAVPFVWISLMAQIRRWHDLDQSGFWCLINFVPCIGPLYSLVMLGFFAGTDGPNEYGDDPLRLVPPEDDKARWGSS